MNMGMKLEHVLRHLKNAEPSIQHWMEFGDFSRSAEVDGVLANAGALSHDLRHMVNGLVVTVHLLAKQSVALQRRIGQLEGNQTPGASGGQNETHDARQGEQWLGQRSEKENLIG